MKLGWPSASNNDREQFDGSNSEYKRCQSHQIIFKPSTHACAPQLSAAAIGGAHFLPLV
jgi:hypothetical protein